MNGNLNHLRAVLSRSEIDEDIFPGSREPNLRVPEDGWIRLNLEKPSVEVAGSTRPGRQMPNVSNKAPRPNERLKTGRPSQALKGRMTNRVVRDQKPDQAYKGRKPNMMKPPEGAKYAKRKAKGQNWTSKEDEEHPDAESIRPSGCRTFASAKKPTSGVIRRLGRRPNERTRRLADECVKRRRRLENRRREDPGRRPRMDRTESLNA